MNPGRWSLTLSILGAGLRGATLLVSSSLGSVGTTTADATGRVVTAEFRTPSILQDSPRTAVGRIAATVVLVVLVALLIRYGGVVGPALVLTVMPLVVLVSILTIGAFLSPGVACLCAAAVLAIIDRESRRTGATPPAGLRPASS